MVRTPGKEKYYEKENGIVVVALVLLPTMRLPSRNMA
jgi:hypothetical protein